MEDWRPDEASRASAGRTDRVWINPSPNAANLNMARAYAGTVMLEGTTLSEGRGTTRPLELFGAPDIDARAVMAEMERLAPEWLAGCKLREISFEPTFHKHVGELCNGAAHPRRRAVLRPSGLHAVAAPGARLQGHPRGSNPTIRCGAISPTNMSSASWRSTSSMARPCFANGSTTAGAKPGDLDALTLPDERAWEEERASYLRY